ncbi:MAG: hypothetical protein H6R26_3226 [Proteobacteria bacterium]|nr:hypothetical protein [Pseudomonadota bacterium]
MPSIIRKTKAYAECIRRVITICRRPGGAEALLARLDDLEREIGAPTTYSRCDECGSTELEPIMSADVTAGVQVSTFRCKACGHEFAAG